MEWNNTMEVNGDHWPSSFENDKKHNKSLYNLISSLVFMHSYCMNTADFEYIVYKLYGSLL